ncbi:hypothetical protein Q5P01_008246 [Channa striata]|uniref:Uncharacterized protein n=1 Tax=Channa striata TaxID=64152 RepID=A0AA88N526_CHASR|nr:hypothetical protein Q5P01_008246 [Channa striata]
MKSKTPKAVPVWCSQRLQRFVEEKDVDPVGQRSLLPEIQRTMTSVNSPACLLARNHFYRNLPTSPEASSAAIAHDQREVTLLITMETPPGGQGVIGTNGLWVSIGLGFDSSLLFSTSRTTSPTDRGVK